MEIEKPRRRRDLFLHLAPFNNFLSGLLLCHQRTTRTCFAICSLPSRRTLMNLARGQWYSWLTTKQKKRLWRFVRLQRPLLLLRLCHPDEHALFGLSRWNEGCNSLCLAHDSKEVPISVEPFLKKISALHLLSASHLLLAFLCTS